MKLSIIIANYNYRDFVGAAISSALAVDWPDKEIIVVDDDSTDDSRSVIDGFRGKVVAYFRPKSHQLGAHIFGFEQSTGDVIIFLDADDLLEPDVMVEVAKVWRPGVSKVQYRMNLIDAAGAQTGTAIPQFPLSDDTEKLRRTFLRAMTYTTPPGSGNAYSRDFVRIAFAMAPSTIPESDAILLTLAPMMGDILTVRRPLARYRIHATNTMLMHSLDAAKIRGRLQQDAQLALLFATATQQLHLPLAHDPLSRNFNHLQYRFASHLVEPSAHPFQGDTVIGLGCRLIYAAITYSQMPLRDRTILLVWIIACALTPSSYRRNLIEWRFVAISRPAVIKTLLGALSSLRSTHLPDRA
jgi:cellulose synthase/poly-beta-1,6-N-acetylglucosamine synthase-like glycosyltransferase